LTEVVEELVAIHTTTAVIVALQFHDDDVGISINSILNLG